MIAWCSYCQKFLSEKPPYEDYSISHGICTSCKKTVWNFDKEKEKNNQALAQFQGELHRLADQRKFSEALDLIEVGIAKGIREVDILIGFLAPLLNSKYGKSESTLETNKSEINTEELNQFTMRLIEAIRQKIKFHLADLLPEVLFVSRSENPYNLGIQMLELWLCAEGIATQAFTGSDDEIIAEFNKHKPKVFGLSIADPSELTACRSLIQRVRSESAIPPFFLVGGMAVKSGQISADDIPEACLIIDSDKLFLMIKNHLALGFLYDLKIKTG